MKHKLIIPALGLILALMGCSIPLNLSGTPPLIVTDTPVPTIASTNTSLPTTC